MVDEIKNYSNDRLLDEIYDLSGGDDWDGGFTKNGWNKFQLTKQEFERRLKEINFLSENY